MISEDLSPDKPNIKEEIKEAEKVMKTEHLQK